MSRPLSEAHYLAGLVPASAAATGVHRRAVLKGLLTGAAVLGGGGLLAGCGGSSGSGGAPAGSPASGSVTLGSNQSDAVPKAAYQAMTDAFGKQG